MTQPDISSAVRTMGNFCENPGMMHWKAVVKILQYVRGTQVIGITYGEDGNGGIEMRACADSDHTTCPGIRHSVSWGAVHLGGGAINGFPRTQEITAAGTSEAEYVELSEIVKELFFLCQVQAFIMPALESHPIDIMEDNKGAIKMANHKHSGERTRHIDIKHHIIRDSVDDGKVCIIYVESGD